MTDSNSKLMTDQEFLDEHEGSMSWDTVEAMVQWLVRHEAPARISPVGRLMIQLWDLWDSALTGTGQRECELEQLMDFWSSKLANDQW